MKTQGERLRDIRVSHGIKTQTAFSKKIGAQVDQYGNWERDVGPIPVPFAIRICDLLGVTLDYIYRGK